jgi:hypothetical protein
VNLFVSSLRAQYFVPGVLAGGDSFLYFKPPNYIDCTGNS